MVLISYLLELISFDDEFNLLQLEPCSLLFPLCSLICDLGLEYFILLEIILMKGLMFHSGLNDNQEILYREDIYLFLILVVPGVVIFP